METIMYCLVGLILIASVNPAVGILGQLYQLLQPEYQPITQLQYQCQQQQLYQIKQQQYQLEEQYQQQQIKLKQKYQEQQYQLQLQYQQLQQQHQNPFQFLPSGQTTPPPSSAVGYSPQLQSASRLI